MRNYLLLSTLLASLTATPGCVQTECGDGTIDKDGVCVPADTSTDPAKCGPYTELHGDRCEPKYQPTQCDPTSSEATFDPMTGITTCFGTGGVGCDMPLPCPQPAGTTKLTICGQLYDFENGSAFSDSGATGKKCDPTTPATSGPCALSVLAFDALVYGMNQTQGNITPGASDITIDDCGRFRVANIETNGTGPFIGLGFTEAGKLPQQPLANLTVTATTGVATSKPSSRVVDKMEAWIAKPSMITSWQNSGGPPLSAGIYVGLFRAHKIGNGPLKDPQPGAKFTKTNNPIPGQDYYFTAAQTTNTTIDINQAVTGANGNGLLTGTSVNDATAYSGVGGITSPHCQWENHAAANLANIVFFQIYRKADVPLDGTPCPE